jgi:hypothetical protein
MTGQPKRDKDMDARARASVEGSDTPTVEPGGSPDRGPKSSEEQPLAGSHAKADLTNPDSTPGTGALTPPGEHDDVDSTSG